VSLDQKADEMHGGFNRGYIFLFAEEIESMLPIFDAQHQSNGNRKHDRSFEFPGKTFCRDEVTKPADDQESLTVESKSSLGS
jgi:hypothetical protein